MYFKIIWNINKRATQRIHYNLNLHSIAIRLFIIKHFDSLTVKFKIILLRYIGSHS